MNPGVLLGSDCAIRKENNNIVEPRPDQMKQSQLIMLLPQPYTGGTKHDGCST